MNNFKKKAVAVAVGSALGLALTSAPAQAAPSYNGCASSTFCTLDELFNGASISMGNGVVFGGFSFASSSNAQPFSNIQVTGDDADPLNVGLLYAGFSIANYYVPAGFLDYSFTVDSTDPLLKLSDADLSVNSAVATYDIFEDLFDAGDVFVDGLHVYDDGQGAVLSDHVDYAPTDYLGVDMFLASEGGFIDGFETYFSLTQMDEPPPNEAPEPGTLALLGAGLAGIGFSRRRKKQS